MIKVVNFKVFLQREQHALFQCGKILKNPTTFALNTSINREGVKDWTSFIFRVFSYEHINVSFTMNLCELDSFNGDCNINEIHTNSLYLQPLKTNQDSTYLKFYTCPTFKILDFSKWIVSNWDENFIIIHLPNAVFSGPGNGICKALKQDDEEDKFHESPIHCVENSLGNG